MSLFFEAEYGIRFRVATREHGDVSKIEGVFHVKQKTAYDLLSGLVG